MFFQSVVAFLGELDVALQHLLDVEESATPHGLALARAGVELVGVLLARTAAALFQLVRFLLGSLLLFVRFILVVLGVGERVILVLVLVGLQLHLLLFLGSHDR